ncbi:hypothetical protein WJX81_008418 [Elliptochloris bilobata]|uniref:Cytosolic endo-beta-N-acetylglucosaminidase TIM barrel domain-containing protein n=1 Tax=Elliptochloris bilobata TaxID=381761 RepID=A0AAW1SHW7_9CHLO
MAEVFCCCSTQLPQGPMLPRRPRLLVCHDMAGGYGSDAAVQGCGDAGAFRLLHWHAIDVFVYFSHHLVTLPPPGWVHAAHRHGVPVLGTLITEWDAGAAVCRRLFSSPASAVQAAAQLAALSAARGFEGWLINIENALPLNCMLNVLVFLRELRRRVHQRCPGGLVIWYDAVTVEGRLLWQDSLTRLNSPFFDACDGIFVNYTWRAGTPVQAAAHAGERAHDVYMGIDVFGRGSIGGGGLACHVAARAARAAGLSAALFAPGWVAEAEDAGPNWPDTAERLWGALGGAWGPPRPLAASLPFATSFDQGAGSRMYLEGRCVSARPWFNLARQQPQPLHQRCAAVRISLGAHNPDSNSQPTTVPALYGTNETRGRRYGPADSGVGKEALGVGLWLGRNSGISERVRVSLAHAEMAACTEGPAWDGGTHLALSGRVPTGSPAWTASFPLYMASVRVPERGLRVSITSMAPGGRGRLGLALDFLAPRAACTTSTLGGCGWAELRGSAATHASRAAGRQLDAAIGPNLHQGGGHSSRAARRP